MNLRSSDRRRRVLVDESRNETISAPRIFRGDADESSPRYGNAALQALNAPIAKYLPLRPYSMLLWFLVGLLPVVGLLTLDGERNRLRPVIGETGVQILDLTARGNLASWCASVAFAMAVLVMLGIYSVRRHRRDDHRGRFTVWRWGMLAALLASVDTATQLHHVWQSVGDYMLGGAGGNSWWIATWLVLFGGTMARLLIEIFAARDALGCAAFAGCCYVIAVGAEWVWGTTGLSRDGQVTQAGLMLLGHHVLLFSLMCYARHVVLEAMGKVRQPRKRKSTPVGESTSKPAGLVVRWRSRWSQGPRLHQGDNEDDIDNSQLGVSKSKTKASKAASTTAAKNRVAAGDSVSSSDARPDTAVDTEPDTEPDKESTLSKRNAPSSERVAASRLKLHEQQEETSPPSLATEPDDDESGGTRLTKTERKRQRKEQKRRTAA